MSKRIAKFVPHLWTKVDLPKMRAKNSLSSAVDLDLLGFGEGEGIEILSLKGPQNHRYIGGLFSMICVCSFPHLKRMIQFDLAHVYIMCVFSF